DHQESMKAHLCVLVHSPYFQSMYNSGLKERQQGEVYIGIGKPKFVKMALIYLYTGKVAIEYSTIKDLLEVADYLQIDSLKEDCSRYLRDVKLTVANCVPLCLMSSLYNIEYYSDVFNF
ncbi:KBTB8-like protein, partial [Mya arenaria]